jgi:uncharacterized membrane protein YfcA
MTTMTVLTGNAGFGSPMTEKTFHKSRRAGVELMATLALAVSLMIAATAVSIGVARAQPFHAVRSAAAAPMAVATFLGAMMGAKIH